MSVLPEAAAEQADLLKGLGLDTLEGAFAFARGEELSKDRLGTRRRTRLRLGDGSGSRVQWYLKRYGPDAWPRRLARRLTGRGRAGPAERELEAIRCLCAAGVPTARSLAAGQESDLLGVRRSYIVLDAVPGDALERCFADCLARWDAAEVQRFNAALVELVRGLHAAGWVHRDLYASHVFLDEAPDGPRLRLIDLARCFAPRWRRFRWRVKDLAQLGYSMPPAWVEQYWDEFLTGYLAGGGQQGRWERAIGRKVATMRRRHRRRQRKEGGS